MSIDQTVLCIYLYKSRYSITFSPHFRLSCSIIPRLSCSLSLSKHHLCQSPSNAPNKTLDLSETVHNPNLSIVRESLTRAEHFCNTDPTNPTWALGGTRSLSSSAALHSLLDVSLHPLHTCAAANSPGGGNLLSTSHKTAAGKPPDSSGSGSRSSSMAKSGSGDSQVRSMLSKDKARRKRE